jgi:hypothetical protein
VPGCGSAGFGGVVNTKARLVLVPRVMAGYSQCRSSVPVTRAIPVCTVDHLQIKYASGWPRNVIG